ncbi:hypothetical protein [Flavobacterium aciduliphilum]|uniref:Uncharacterized protein n=1 Tax=Flavobacterium aciduliphilum TaxID=1101402 RepID=A0A328YRB2_9FLAO|nr:hypothetical protein [Flavobacterium aciduliphilum]RAR75335.1 hypothetical protein CLV55_10130 [Flavobacterium aciduliphilum]
MKIKINRIYFNALFVVITCFLVLWKGVVYAPDSEGYLSMSIYRSLGYPSFILFHKALFGSRYVYFVLLSQLLLNLGAIFYLKNKVQQILNLPFWKAFLFMLLLAIPLFYEIHVANGLLSEALAYPLYLIVLAHLFDFLVTKNRKKVILSAILLLLLIQVRGQFMFLVVVLFLAVFVSEMSFKLLKKQIGILVFIILIPFISVGIDICFHKIVHHKAVTTPWTGIQIATLPFFIANQKDYLEFPSTEQQDYFRFIYGRLEQKNLLLNQFSDDSTTKMDYYFSHYVQIANGTLNNDGESFFKNNHVLQEDLVVVNDKMTSSMTMPLVKAHFFKWVSLYFENICKGLGTAKNVLLILFLCVFSFFRLLSKPIPALKIIFIGTLLVLGNAALVALAEPTISRYLFYNNWVLLSIVLLLFDFSFYKKEDE